MGELKLQIFFKHKNIDKEIVREIIEDNLGVEILEMEWVEK